VPSTLKFSRPWLPLKKSGTRSPPVFRQNPLSPYPKGGRSTPHPELIIPESDTALPADHDNVIRVLNYLLTTAVSAGASDIHIEPLENRLRVRYRIDGILQHKTDLPLDLAPPLSSRIKVLCGLDIAERRRHQDGRIEIRVRGEEVDLRVSTYVSAYGETVVIRILHRHTSLVDLDQLGFSPAHRAGFQRILDYPSGIILITGPTGSGKTTTMYASLHYLNRLDRKIITVEDPIEYQIDGITQGRLDPKLGLTYSDFIKAMMRQDPDVLMIGEVRDKTSAEAVIQAALTGHKVFSTFHTEDTIGALLRLMDMDIETFLISSTVVCVVSQRLVRLLCVHCRKLYYPDSDLLRAFHIDPGSAAKYPFYQGRGCKHCQGSGYKGRTGIHEILVLNDPIRDAILARRPSSQIRLLARDRAHLISLREDGFYKAVQGLTALDEVLRVVFHQESDDLPLRNADHILSLCASLPPTLQQAA
jgi:type IV pilus assembly protein PilB